jgi:Uncharacterized enzyme of heme biosynthesis
MYLTTFTVITSIFVLWRFGVNSGLVVLGGGLILSYFAMLQKRDFIPPKQKITARRMARSISQDTSPLSIARFASQLYYYFHKPTQAISLLEKFLSTHDPLLCMTLGDILLKEGEPQRALYVLRDNPHSFLNPLLLSTQGHVLKKIGKIPEATRMFERSLHLAKQNGLPQSRSHWVTQKLLNLGYKASIHHTLADCYVILQDFPKAKYHCRAGNRLLFDFSLWHYCPTQPVVSAKNYKES